MGWEEKVNDRVYLIQRRHCQCWVSEVKLRVAACWAHGKCLLGGVRKGELGLLAVGKYGSMSFEGEKLALSE